MHYLKKHIPVWFTCKLYNYYVLLCLSHLLCLFGIKENQHIFKGFILRLSSHQEHFVLQTNILLILSSKVTFLHFAYSSDSHMAENARERLENHQARQATKKDFEATIHSSCS